MKTNFGIKGAMKIEALPDEEVVWKHVSGHVYHDESYARLPGSFTLRAMKARPPATGHVVVTNQRLLFLPGRFQPVKGLPARTIPIEDIRTVELQNGQGLRGLFKGSPYKSVLVTDKNGEEFQFSKANFTNMAAFAKELDQEIKKVQSVQVA